jgi:hypothetical protein
MSFDHNPLLVDDDQRRHEQRREPARYDWLLSLERPVPRRSRIFRRLAELVTR